MEGSTVFSRSRRAQKHPGNAGCPGLPVGGIGLGVIQAPERSWSGPLGALDATRLDPNCDNLFITDGAIWPSRVPPRLTLHFFAFVIGGEIG
jgi:hypothetical protein